MTLREHTVNLLRQQRISALCRVADAEAIIDEDNTLEGEALDAAIAVMLAADEALAALDRQIAFHAAIVASETWTETGRWDTS